MSHPWYVQFILTLLPSLVVAVVAALLAVRLALRRFYTERWWERKAEAYSRIVEALHRHKNYAVQKLKLELKYQYPMAKEEDKKKEREEKDKELEEQWAEANKELERAVDLGAFVISENAEDIIRNFLNRKIGDLEYDPFVEIIGTDLKKTEDCLAAIKHEAKKDLRIDED